VRASPAIIERMIAAKQAMDTCTNLPAQLLIDAFLASGAMDDHLERLRAEYRVRKQGMVDALAGCFGDEASWSDPAGGFFIWLTLGEEIDTEALFERALAAGVAYIPGRAFSVQGGFGNALRLCFAFNDPQRTRVGIERLRDAIDEGRR
jgi:2-aminoadipate transaminase